MESVILIIKGMFTGDATEIKQLTNRGSSPRGTITDRRRHICNVCGAPR